MQNVLSDSKFAYNWHNNSHCFERKILYKIFVSRTESSLDILLIHYTFTQTIIIITIITKLKNFVIFLVIFFVISFLK